MLTFVGNGLPLVRLLVLFCVFRGWESCKKMTIRLEHYYSGYQSHAPLNDFFPIWKTKFWWTSLKCFHDNSRVHFVSVSQPCSLVRRIKYKSLNYSDRVICCFAEMEGYHVEKTWSVFESHSRNTFCKPNVCEEGGISIVWKQCYNPWCNAADPCGWFQKWNDYS